VRLETLSTFDFGPKKGFCLAHFGPILPSPSAYPSWFLLGQVSGTRSSPGHCVVLGHIQQIRCRSNFAIPSKAYQEYKASYHFAYPTVQHVSSNMQSHPHDASRNYSYQRHNQTSLSPSHPPNYVDHSGHHNTSGQPMGYHPVAQSPQVQRQTYGHPQDPHHPGMHTLSPIPVNLHSHEHKQQSSPATTLLCQASLSPNNRGRP